MCFDKITSVFVVLVVVLFAYNNELNCSVLVDERWLTVSVAKKVQAAQGVTVKIENRSAASADCY